MAKPFKSLKLGDNVVTTADLASASTAGLVKIGSGLVVGSDGSVYLKILQSGKLFLPSSGESLSETKTIGGKSYPAGTPIYRAISLAYSAEQEAAIADVSAEAYVWNDSTGSYVEVV